jgi:hypothetical protein
MRLVRRSGLFATDEQRQRGDEPSDTETRCRFEAKAAVT